MHILQRVMVASQNRLSCLLHKKTSIIGTGLTFEGPGGGAGTRANSRVEYLFILSFSLPLCHPQAWPALARVILGRDGQKTESKHMKHEENVNTTLFLPVYQKKASKSAPLKRLKEKPALHFGGTCLKHVARLKMSLLESGEAIMLLFTVQLVCYMYESWTNVLIQA